MHRLEQRNQGIRYSSEEFEHEMQDLSNDVANSVGVNLVRGNRSRNLIRNSGQYWKALNLIPANSRGRVELTDFGRAVAGHRISQTQFAAVTVQTLTLPNPHILTQEECIRWRNVGIALHPLKLILQIIIALYDHERVAGYITPQELIDVVIPLSSSPDVEISDYTNFIVRYRNGDLSRDGWPNIIPDSNDSRMAREHLLFLANYGYLSAQEDGTDRWTKSFRYNNLLDAEIRAIINQDEGGLSSIVAAANVQDIAAEVERIRVQSHQNRPHQAEFRRAILSGYRGCVITNVTMPEILEAAHIIPFRYNGPDTIENGFAMRTDIHTLFDAGHLRISPDGDIELSDRARMDYGALIPPRINIPDFVNRDNIRWRYDNYGGL